MAAYSFTKEKEGVIDTGAVLVTQGVYSCK